MSFCQKVEHFKTNTQKTFRKWSFYKLYLLLVQKFVSFVNNWKTHEYSYFIFYIFIFMYIGPVQSDTWHPSLIDKSRRRNRVSVLVDIARDLKVEMNNKLGHVSQMQFIDFAGDIPKGLKIMFKGNKENVSPYILIILTQLWRLTAYSYILNNDDHKSALE